MTKLQESPVETQSGDRTPGMSETLHSEIVQDTSRAGSSDCLNPVRECSVPCPGPGPSRGHPRNPRGNGTSGAGAGDSDSEHSPPPTPELMPATSGHSALAPTPLTYCLSTAIQRTWALTLPSRTSKGEVTMGSRLSHASPGDVRSRPRPHMLGGH